MPHITLHRRAFAALLAPALTLGALAAGLPVSGGTWGTAQEVPGTAALNVGGNAGVEAVSCPSAGNCTAAGYYTPAPSGGFEAFAISQVDGAWGTAAEIPAAAPLNGAGISRVYSLSCPSAGNCAAGGYYTDEFGRWQPFVVNQTDGVWDTAEQVPGITALNLGDALVESVSCASAGNCTAGGQYEDRSGNGQNFVVSEIDGTWGDARKLPGIAAIQPGGSAAYDTVSCPSAGNCEDDGSYFLDPRARPFVATETNGTWGTAEKLPGITALVKDGNATIVSVSCASAGNCGAGGSYYYPRSSHSKAFVASKRDGTWRTVTQVPGLAALSTDPVAGVTSVSCASARDCTAGGTYYAVHHGIGEGIEGFVVSETKGTWGTAQKIPGLAALNISGDVQLESLSCAPAGNCATGGSYYDGSGHHQAFLADQADGTWSRAEEVPGSAALNQGGNAAVTSVSCGAAGNCAAGGSYHDGSGHQQAFIVSETSGS